MSVICEIKEHNLLQKKLDSMKKAPEKMKAFIAQILRSEPEKNVPKREIESQITK